MLIPLSKDTVLVFGKETKACRVLLQAHPERCIRIPMQSESRSLNLAMRGRCFVEVLRQQVSRAFSCQ